MTNTKDDNNNTDNTNVTSTQYVYELYCMLTGEVIMRSTSEYSVKAFRDKNYPHTNTYIKRSKQ